MNKAELVKALEERLGSRKAAQEALEVVLDTIVREVAKGGRVAITGFMLIALVWNARLKAARSPYADDVMEHSGIIPIIMTSEPPRSRQYRADRAIAFALEHMQSRDVVFVGHGHFSRAVITRWIEQPVYEGIRFAMPAVSIAVCGFEHGVRQLSALDLTGRPAPAVST